MREGDDLKIVTRYYSPAAPLEATHRDPVLFRPGPASCVRRSIRLKQVVQVPELANDQAYFDREQAHVRLVELGYRSQLSVPLIKHNEAIGAFNVYRIARAGRNHRWNARFLGGHRCRVADGYDLRSSGGVAGFA